jgi:hypothetical protein
MIPNWFSSGKPFPDKSRRFTIVLMISLRSFIPKSLIEYKQSLKNYLIGRRSRLSNFNPGSRLSTLLDAISFQMAKSDLEYFDGFNNVIYGLYEAFNFKRLPGQRSFGYFRIEMDNTLGTEVIQFPILNVNLFGIAFETIRAVEIPIGGSFVEVEARAIELGTDGNIEPLRVDTSEGFGTISPALPSSARIWNPTAFSGGTEIESDDSRVRRFKNYITSLGRSTPLGIYSGITSVPGVVGAVVETNVNPFTRMEEIGWINCFITDGTSNPPQSLLDLVRKTIEGDAMDRLNFPGYASAGARVYVTGTPILPINVTFDIKVRIDSLLTDEAITSITRNSATAYVNTLPLNQDVLYDLLKGKILTSHPDFFGITMVTPTADVIVPFGSLARIGGDGGVLTLRNIIREEQT